MDNESRFLQGLLGRLVQIVLVDEENLPPLTLLEISTIGVVADDAGRARFFPWKEIVEISAYDAEAARELSAMLCVDSEP